MHTVGSRLTSPLLSGSLSIRKKIVGYRFTAHGMHTYSMCVQLSGSLAYPDIFLWKMDVCGLKRGLIVHSCLGYPDAEVYRRASFGVNPLESIAFFASSVLWQSRFVTFVETVTSSVLPNRPIFEGSSENRSEKGNVRKAAKMSEIITFLCRSPVLSLFSATEGTNHCTFASKKASAWLWKCKVTCLDQAGWHVR